jgi:CHAT domain-containing protein
MYRVRLSFNIAIQVLFLCSLTFCLWFGEFGQLVTAQSPDALQLVQQGIERYKAGDFQGAIPPWEDALNFYRKSNNRVNEAIVNENLARAYQQLGESEKALSYWEQVIVYYRAAGDLQKMGRMFTEQAQAYSSIGQPRKAVAILESALQIARNQQDKRGEVAALGSLGEAYRLRGEYENAIKYLTQAQEIKEPLYYSRVLNSLGNAYVSRAQLENIRANSAEKLGIPKAREFKQKAIDDYTKAWEFFESSLQLAQKQDDKSSKVQTLLNLIKLHYRSQALNIGKQAEADKAVQEALLLLDKLPNSRNKVYALIDLANLTESAVDVASPLVSCSSKRRLPISQSQKLLIDAVKTAQSLKDSRSESFALGSLAHFYECSQEYQQALELTRKALLAADQNMNAKDSLYLWEWQAGRILQALGKEEEALSALERAYSILEKIRGDILSADREIQLDFRDVIEPVYRELAQLKLELASLPSIDISNRNQELTDALQTIESLKLAELQNFFGDDCVLTAINDKSVDELLGKDTAVFSSIILEKGIAILLSLPNKEKKLEFLTEKPETVLEEIRKFRNGLVRGRRVFDYDTTQAQKLYDWMIRPFEKDLNSQAVKTLVFIHDGILRTIPMAALYDSNQKQYLVEKYALATTPSLSLTAPKIGNSQKNRALILGLTKEAKVDDKPYPALTNVLSEIQVVQSKFPDNKPLIDEEFNRERLEKELNQTTYPIIHIATHAQFGTIPEDTFLVTGNNDKLTINQLENALRQVSTNSGGAVELLSLTACETALGDERAALGLAGVAIQAGTRSALASLWSVPDQSTFKLVTEFYASLKSGMSKAEALSAAQRKLISAKNLEDIDDKYDNPAYWAPFIIIGNWL